MTHLTGDKRLKPVQASNLQELSGLCNPVVQSEGQAASFGFDQCSSYSQDAGVSCKTYLGFNQKKTLRLQAIKPHQRRQRMILLV